MKEGRFINDNKEKGFCFFACFLLLAGVLAHNMGELTQPYFTDEVGYWAAGAWINGIDWSSVMSKTGYYGYGYGIFLAPLFLLRNSQYMFYGAVILNIVMVLLLFLTLYGILRELFREIDYRKIMLAALVPCLYTYIVVYTQLTMSEICLTLFSALYIYLMILLAKKITLTRTVLLALVTGCLVAIHLRTLIFVIITAAYFFLMFCLKKITIKELLILAVSVLVFIVIVFGIKEIVIDKIYTDTITMTHNDHNDNIANKIGTINAYLNIEFVYNYLMCFIAKVFYLSVSTLFLFNFSVVHLIKNIRISFREKQEERFKIYAFLFITLLLMLLYASFISGKTTITRTDGLMYGRYMENIFPLFIALGIVEFGRRKNRRGILLYSVLICLGSAILCYEYIQILGLDGLFPSMMPMQISGVMGLSGIKQMDKALGITIYVTMIVCVIGFILYLLSRKLNNLVLVIIPIIWIVWANNGIKDYVYNTYETVNVNENSKLAQFEIIKEAADYLDRLDRDKIYYIIEEGETTNPSYFQMYDLQFDLVDQPLTVVNYEQFLNCPKDSIIVVNRYDTNFESVKGKVEIMFENDYFIIGNK